MLIKSRSYSGNRGKLLSNTFIKWNLKTLSKLEIPKQFINQYSTVTTFVLRYSFKASIPGKKNI